MSLPLPGEPSRGATWPDVALAALKHPFVALALSATAFAFATACQLGYSFHDLNPPALERQAIAHPEVTP